MAHLVDNWVRAWPWIRHNPASRVGFPTLTEKPHPVFFSASVKGFTWTFIRRKLFLLVSP